MPAKRKRLVVIVLIALILIAAAVTVYLNRARSGYRVLYPGMDAQESLDVYQAVQDLGVAPRLDARDQLMVPETQYDYLLLELAALGYPKSTLTYDTFLNNAGLTATESDKRQVLIFELQDRAQATLRRFDAVENAVVTMALPENYNSIWLAANRDQAPATASVLLTLRRDAVYYTGQDGEQYADPSLVLYPEQVSAIKNLIAHGVPGMDPVNVTVVDAASGLELAGMDSAATGVGASRQALQLEQTFQDQIESNVRRILIPWYGDEGVFVVARVILDLDRMMQERMELLPRLGPEGEDAGGFTTHHEVEGVVEGAGNVFGIVGEENNTDVPTYVLEGGAAGTDYEHYFGAIDYDYGYLKTQIEGGNARIARGTVSVIVDERDMTEARRAELIDIISKSADIAPEFIALSPLNPPPAPIPDIVVEPDPAAATGWNIPFWVYIAAGAFLLLVILLIMIFILLRRRAARVAAQREEELKAQQEEMGNEIERYKQELADAAKASVNPKDDAITGEIRQFARENPEITANLLRNWLKEGES